MLLIGVYFYLFFIERLSIFIPVLLLYRLVVLQLIIIPLVYV